MSRLVVVTGAAGDVGSAVVRQAAEAGVDVVAADLSTAQPGPAHPRVTRASLDLADDDSIRDLVSRVRQHCDDPGFVGIAHCAGVARVGPFTDARPDDWDLMYRVNQRGPLLLTQLLLPLLAEASASSIVFVGSDSARAGAGHEVAYAATKAALLGAAKSLARELARDGTRVNVVSPGPIDGQMVRAATADEPAYLDKLVRGIPLHRLADPAEVAAAVTWLLGPDSTYVTGQTLSVSGGITMH